MKKTKKINIVEQVVIYQCGADVGGSQSHLFKKCKFFKMDDKTHKCKYLNEDGSFWLCKNDNAILERFMMVNNYSDNVKNFEFKLWDKKAKKFREDVCLTLDYGVELKACSDDYEIVQWTGKKDKNQKKVFEKDIVKTVDGNMLVVFVSAFSGFLLKKNGFAFDYSFYDYPDIEIIGNVFENPELLKSEE